MSNQDFCQRVEILVFVNQGNKLLRRFPALLIAGNGLFQFRDFRIKGVLLFGVLCVQGLIPGVRQLSRVSGARGRGSPVETSKRETL